MVVEVVGSVAVASRHTSSQNRFEDSSSWSAPYAPWRSSELSSAGVSLRWRSPSPPSFVSMPFSTA